jgi:endogenous inhibitor of DNA gyrase (YacG/DUF329 family)
VELKHGFEHGALEPDEDEDYPTVAFATCPICGKKFRRREANGMAIYEEWTSTIREIDFRGIKLGPFLRRWKKLKEKRIPLDTGEDENDEDDFDNEEDEALQDDES